MAQTFDHEAYEQDERARLARQLQDIYRAPLTERREARYEWAAAMREHPAIVAERIEWLFAGHYGYGALRAADEAVRAGHGTNRAARIGQLIAALEWQCAPTEARKAWHMLTTEEQTAITRQIDDAIYFRSQQLAERDEADR